MTAPSRAVTVVIPLTDGKHTAELHGITAPDDIGTYYISFPSAISVIQGEATTGSDLTAGRVKSWVIEVKASPNRIMQDRTQSPYQPEIMWEE